MCKPMTKEYLGNCLECSFTSNIKKDFHTKKQCRICYNLLQRIRNKAVKIKYAEKYKSYSRLYMSKPRLSGTCYHKMVYGYNTECKRIRNILIEV